MGRVDERMALRRRAARGLIALAGAALSLTAAAQTAPPADAASAPAGPPSWRIDPTHTFVHWEVLHMSTSTIRGRFDKSAGVVLFDPKAQTLDISISIDTASVNSGVPVLDAMLKGSGMLDAAANPQAYFTARNARFEGEAPRELRGEFTLRGVSQPLTLRALRWHCGLNRTVCGGDFEGEIVRSAFGITHSLPLVADKVRLVVQVEAIAPG
jgi:polyisoprenoid-binding protein YceI